MHPNTRRCEMHGFFPLHASSGVMEGKALVGHRLRTYTAFTTASAQNSNFMCWAWIMLLAISTMVRFARSATPFCCSVGYRRLLLDPMGLQECKECIGHILAAVVRSQDLDLVLWLCFHKRLILSKPLKALSLGLQDVHPHLSREVIYECHKVLPSPYRSSSHRTTHIRMHYL